MAASDHDFDLDAADALRTAVGMLIRATRELTAEYPDGQLETLGVLMRDGPQSIAGLARRRQVRHQTMSTTVAELEVEGLVERSADPNDARGVLIAVTAAGAAAILSNRRERASAVLRAAESRLGPDERRLLRRVPEILGTLAAGVADPDPTPSD